MLTKDQLRKRRWQQHNQHKQTQKRRERPAPTAHRTLMKLSRDELRWMCIQAYGGKCACCGEDNCDLLIIVHVNNDGFRDKRQAIYRYRWIVKNRYPSSFQVLCWNCNLAKGILGYCPHQHRAPRQTEREECLKGYGGKCARCGEMNSYFLAFDHVNNDGATMRRNRTHPNGGKEFYRWIIRRNFPPIFQILCHNCNRLKELEK